MSTCQCQDVCCFILSIFERLSNATDPTAAETGAARQTDAARLPPDTLIPGTEIPDSAVRMTGPNGVLQGEGVSPSDYTQSAF